MSDFSYSKFIDVNGETGQVFFEDVIDPDDGYWFYIPERVFLDKEMDSNVIDG